MRDDIRGGLRNALDKGEPLDSAIRSFVNAGYKDSEVREAAQSLELGALSIAHPVSSQMSVPKPLPLPQKRKLNFKFPKIHFKKIGLATILIAILVILIIVFVMSLVFREQIIGFFQ